MIVECIDNDGFEDVLTKGACYTVESLGQGDASYRVATDQDTFGWFGAAKFRVVA